MRMKVTRLAVLAVGATILVAACSSGATSAPGSPGASTGGGGEKGTLKLGVTLPLSGGAAADGQPTLKGAQLAVDQANEAGGVGGYKIELVPLDHAVNGKYNEQQASQDMQTFVGDAAVFGVVGPYNSAVGKVQIPIGNDAGLLQCSPANTNQGLTKPEFGAPPDTTDFNGIISAAKAKNPDGVYYGGVVTSGAGLLLKQMRQQGLNIPFTGPDGIVNGAGDAEGSLIQIAGKDAAAGSWGTIAAIGDFPGKADFTAQFEEHFKNDATFNTPGVRTWATDTSHPFDTVLGTESFDKNGDTTLPFISYYTVDPAAKGGVGDWVFKEQLDFSKQ
jgi:ABC-type branched-subunit amino acid transport system substrate-binding protein